MPVSGRIADWDVTTLVRVIKDILEQNPSQNLAQLAADEVIVNRRLSVRDVIEFTKNINYSVVGGTGSAAFQNSWTHYGAPYHNAAYWRDPLGFIHLRGVIKSGVVGSTAFTLPPGFRPPGECAFIALSNGTTGRVDIQTDGDVIPSSPSNNASVVLDGLYFKAAST